MKTKQIIKTLRYMPLITSQRGELAIETAIQKLQTLEQERDEAVEIARTAIGAIEMIFGHAQFCDQCQSFEIAKQCRDELHGFDRLNSLDKK
jgi:hypothetical protein